MLTDNEANPLLDPLDRICEILFGLIMAVTIVGSLSVATAGQAEIRTILAAALGCNLAWGLVDALMYLMRTTIERTRNRRLAKQVIGTEPERARRLIADALPPHVLAITGPAELEGMHGRLLALDLDGRAVLEPRDWLEAFAVFLLVVVATFPVVVPFLLTSDVALAMNLSRAITLAMLFIAGYALSRYAGLARPIVPALMLALLGVALIGAVKALGG